MGNQLRIILGLVVLVSTSWGGFIEAIRDYDKDYATIPHVLSASGMYADFANQVIAEDLVKYSVNTPYWVDGTHKERWISLPPGTSITPTDTNKWSYPEGTVIAKNFYLDTIAGDPLSRVTIETRLLIKREDRWRNLGYEWRLDQTEAYLVHKSLGNKVFFRRWVNGTEEMFRWRYPSPSECIQCHGPTVGAVGIVGPNMNMPSPFDAGKNQLQELNERGILSVNLLAANPDLHKWAAKDDANATLEVKARSWFAMNCGYCHGDEDNRGGTHSFAYWQAEKEPNYLNLEYTHPEFPKLLYPGHPDSSYFVKRMTSRGTFNTYNGDQMPRLLTYQVDSAAVRVISDWICEMEGLAAGCNPIAYAPTVSPHEDEFISEKADIYLEGIKTLPVIPHSLQAVEGFTAFVKNQTLYVSGLKGLSVDVQLVDLKGKPVSILPLENNRFYVRGQLTAGVYVLKAGSRVFKFNYIE